MKNLKRTLLAIAAGLLAAGAQAATWQFNAHLTPAQEVPPNGSPADGLATLHYDDRGTADWADDIYDFSLSVFNLTGPAMGYHIHGAAAMGETGPVRVDLADAPFVSWVNGGTLLLGGNDVGAMMVPATPASATNSGYPAMSFLDMLRNGLAYVNVHTAAHPAGEVRGQLMLVTQAVPEPSTYALMLAGIGALGWLGRKRRRGA